MAATSRGAARLASFYGMLSPSLDMILAALSAAGVSADRVTARDLYERDLDCHNLGMHAMFAVLAQVATDYGPPAPEDVVLDLGCGLGGPGRFLADRFGCEVVGVDLLPSRVDLAQTLTELTQMGDRVSYRVADATDLDAEESSFSQVWMLDVGIHIRDKRALFAEVRRMLRPGGLFVMHDQTGPLPKAMLPVTRQVPYVAPSLPQMIRYVEGAGLRALTWRDTTDIVLRYFTEARSRLTDGTRAVAAAWGPKQRNRGIAAIDGYIETLANLDGRTGILVAKRTS